MRPEHRIFTKMTLELVQPHTTAGSFQIMKANPYIWWLAFLYEKWRIGRPICTGYIPPELQVACQETNYR